MIALIIKLLYIIFIAYFLMALVICGRDLALTKGSKLWIPVMSMAIAIFTLLFATSLLPALALPFTLFISLPIFLTDKRRNWDGLDRVFRIVSLIALIGAAFVTINHMVR